MDQKDTETEAGAETETDKEQIELPEIVFSQSTDKSENNQSNEKEDPTQQSTIKPQTSDVETASNQTHKKIDYELLQWIGIIFFTLIAVIDRFTVNLWPLWVDSPGPTIPGNVGVSTFALIAWISSRMMLVSSSYIFLFQCRVFWNWFVEHRIVNKYIKIGDIMQTNINLHYHVGWALIGIPVVLHVWAIVFAAAFAQNSVKLYPNWMRPKNPDGTSISFYADNLLSLGINDVYRIVSTSLTFFILIPFSIVNCTKTLNWSRAQYIHLFGALIYTVDLVRMKSHPHCWVFNCPFILWWICDRVYGIFFYRRCVAQLVNKVVLDDKHCILYLKVPPQLYSLRSVGDVFFFNFLDPHWDKAHPFTIFWNHQSKNKMLSESELGLKWGGHKFHIYKESIDDASRYLMSRQSTAAEAGGGFINMNMNAESKEEQNSVGLNDGYDWDLAIIMQVFPSCDGVFSGRKTWTSEALSRDIRSMLGLRAWGPYRSEYRVLIKEEDDDKYPKVPSVLIGTGCGCSYLIDYYQYIVSHNLTLNEPISFYFSTRSIAMFQWFTDITCSKPIDNFFVNAHITSHDNISYNQKKEKSRDSRIGRMGIHEILDNAAPNTQVFYCGSPNVQNMVNDICKKRKLTFHAGHSFY